MRRRLMAAAAMAPLIFGAQAAYAQLSITNSTSTPVATATAVNSAPADIDLASGATFTVNSATPAITLNSNNNVTVEGAINANNVNNATAILVQGPYTGNLTTSGTITLTESYTPTSSNNNGITDAPYAQGQNRVAIQVTGPLTGTITNSGAISIQSNNSAGIQVLSTLNGSLESTGGITITGDNNYAIRTTGEVTGEVRVTGAISVKGQNSVGVQATGPIDGSFRVYSSITTTGYAVSVRETGQLLTTIEKTPADVQQGGSAVQIGGNVSGGVFLGAPPAGTVSTDTTTDADNDGVVDSVEGTSSLTTYGSAPALSIGGSSPITIGNFDSTVNPYGLTIEGSVSGQGLIDGVSAKAVDIGGAGVNLSGGIHVTSTSTVSAVAYQADATAIHLGAGVTASGILNDGTISAAVTSASANTASGLIIDAGATVYTLSNNGTITAGVTGDSANSQAVIDHGGHITNVINTGVINAGLTPALPGEIVTGKAIGLDLSANTTGVTLLQYQGPNASVTPAIFGDILLGSGVNNVSILAGQVKGSLSMGGAAGDSLTIDNGASYIGALTYTGPSMAINLANGKLQDNSPTTINASSLTVGGSSVLTVNLDPINNRSTLFNVSGAATFANGAQIGATLSSAPPLSGQTFTIVKANSLSTGNLSASLTLPYMFNGSLSTTTNTIQITVNTKSTTQLGLNKSETVAFNAIYADLPQDSGVQTALINAADRPTFIGAYDQLLPDSNGDVFNTALGLSKSVSRATADRFDLSTEKDDEDDDDFIVSGFWASEFYSGMEQNKADNTAYHSAALGVIGGYDFGGTGFTLSASSSNITRPHALGDSLNALSVVELGAYAAPKFGALSIDARLGAGWLNVSERREFVAQVVSGDLSSTSTISRTAKGDWSGYDLSAHLGAGLQLDVTRHLFFQPKVYADIFHMHESAYNERNGGPGYDLNVTERNGTQTNGTASVVTGLRFGNQFVISPQLELGYDKVVSGGPGDTTARFAYGGPSFTVGPNHIDGAALGRLTLRGDGNYVHFSLQAGGEYSSGYHSMDMKAVFRLTF
jgi:hypothetical protein